MCHFLHRSHHWYLLPGRYVASQLAKWKWDGMMRLMCGVCMGSADALGTILLELSSLQKQWTQKGCRKDWWPVLETTFSYTRVIAVIGRVSMLMFAYARADQFNYPVKFLRQKTWALDHTLHGEGLWWRGVVRLRLSLGLVVSDNSFYKNRNCRTLQCNV